MKVALKYANTDWLKSGARWLVFCSSTNQRWLISTSPSSTNYTTFIFSSHSSV